MLAQNEIILTELAHLKQRELQETAAAYRLAKSARQERPPRIRIAGGWFLRRLRHQAEVNLPRAC